MNLELFLLPFGCLITPLRPSWSFCKTVLVLTTVYIENIFFFVFKGQERCLGLEIFSSNSSLKILSSSLWTCGWKLTEKLMSIRRLDSCLLLLVKSSLIWTCAGSILWSPAAVSCYGVLLWYPAAVSTDILSSDAWLSPLAHLRFLFSFKKELCLSLCSGTPTRHA